jgi:hypothetical protein
MTQKLNCRFTFIVTIISLVLISLLSACNSPLQYRQCPNKNNALLQKQILLQKQRQQQLVSNQNSQTPIKLSQHYATLSPKSQNNNRAAQQIYRYENYPQNKNSSQNNFSGVFAQLMPNNNNSNQILQASYADINPAVIRQMNGNIQSDESNSSTLEQQNPTDPQPTIRKTPPPKADIESLIQSPLSNTANNRQSQNVNAAKNNNSYNSRNANYAKNVNSGIRQEFIREITPQNNRQWSPNHAVLQTASFNNNYVTINNVRYSRYNSSNDYQTRYYNATFDLDQIRTIDLIVVPLKGLPSIAHIESSFGFADGKHILMSITARYEEGEIFDPIAAALRQFELIYVFADERDVLQLDSQINKNDVYLYQLNFNPSEVRTIFVDALQRANKIAQKPEFYHPIRNSCVTNLIDHINKGRPKAIPANYRTLMPGMLGKYIFDLKLVDTTEIDFKVVREKAKINWLVERFGDLEYFSAGIRNQTYKLK